MKQVVTFLKGWAFAGETGHFSEDNWDSWFLRLHLFILSSTRKMLSLLPLASPPLSYCWMQLLRAHLQTLAVCPAKSNQSAWLPLEISCVLFINAGYQLSSFSINGTLSRSHFGVYQNGYWGTILLLLCSWLRAITVGIFQKVLTTSQNFCYAFVCRVSSSHSVFLFKVSWWIIVFNDFLCSLLLPTHAPLTPVLFCVLPQMFPSVPHLHLLILPLWSYCGHCQLSGLSLCFIPLLHNSKLPLLLLRASSESS